MAKLPPDFKEFAELLNSHGVRYLVVGGYAVAYHGYPRATGDIDFLLEPSVENADRVLGVLAESGFGSLGLTREDFAAPERIIQLGYPPIRIDLLTSISGCTWDEAWAERIADELDDVPVYLLSKALLLRNKGASGRLKDQADVDRLT